MDRGRSKEKEKDHLCELLARMQISNLDDQTNIQILITHDPILSASDRRIAVADMQVDRELPLVENRALVLTICPGSIKNRD